MKDRSGDMVDCGLIRSLVGMLSAIDMYSKFESDLLAESNKYFLQQSKEWISLTRPCKVGYVFHRIRSEWPSGRHTPL